ncbi:MAG: hypothetical protein IPL78_18605 [Chloroflexi bacterium]|nr:hypothetical protein [Chloroflexota bacterium]
MLALPGVSWSEGRAAAAQPSSLSLWRDASANEVAGLAPQVQPGAYRLVALEANQLEGILAAAPPEFTSVTSGNHRRTPPARRRLCPVQPQPFPHHGRRTGPTLPRNPDLQWSGRR